MEVEQEIIRNDENSFKIVDYTPKETVYNLDDLLEKKESLESILLNTQKDLNETSSLIAKVQALPVTPVEPVLEE